MRKNIIYTIIAGIVLLVFGASWWFINLYIFRDHLTSDGIWVHYATWQHSTEYNNWYYSHNISLWLIYIGIIVLIVGLIVGVALKVWKKN